MNKIFATACVICICDFLKECMIFRGILGYECKQRLLTKIVPFVFIVITMFLTMLLQVPYKYISILFIPYIFVALWLSFFKMDTGMVMCYIISYICVCQIDVLIEVILSTLNVWRMSELQVDLICAFISLVVVYIIIWLCKKCDLNYIRQSSPPLLVFMLMLIIVLVGLMLGIVSNIAKSNKDLFYGQMLYLIVCILSIIVTGIGFVLYILMLSHKRHEAMELLNQKVIDMQGKYYEELRMRNNDIRKFRHDIKEHLICLRFLVQQDKKEEVIEYFDTLQIHLNSFKKTSVGNDIVDAILNDKEQEAQKSGIRFEVCGRIPQDNHIRNYDYCIIFANALNNAIEASNKFQGEKVIKVTIREVNDFLSICFKNTSNPVVNLMTSKKNPQNHGYGLNSIISCVEKLQGNVKIFQKGKYFSLDILVKNK